MGLHRPLQRDHVAAIVAHHALGVAGGTGGIEDVQRIGGRDGDATGLAAARLGIGDRPRPVVIAAGEHLRLRHRPLQHQHGARLMLG